MKIQPSLEAVIGHRGPETHVALTAELFADTETPISIFSSLCAGRPNALLLESVEGGELMGRYSFVARDVGRRFEFSDGKGRMHRDGEVEEVTFTDPLDVIQRELAGWTVLTPEHLPLPRFFGGAVGYLGFDCIRYFERVPLPAGDSSVPEGIVFFPDELVVQDHLRHRIILIVHARLDGDRAEAYAEGRARLEGILQQLATASMRPSPPWPIEDAGELPAMTINRTEADMESAVLTAREAIAEGEVFQVVLSQRMTTQAEVDPLALYRALRTLNPSPYMFLLRFDAFSVVGASPEVLVRLEGDQILVRPIAGTRTRGASPEQDRALEAELRADEKELAEHRMLLDLGRNDVGRVAAKGQVHVEDALHVERYSHVMHLVSDVRGTLAPGRDCFDVFRACFPAGTLSGAPKIRACELIAALEPDRRGVYGGAVGYFGVDGSMDTCIAIRTLVVHPDRVEIQAGAGIVYDSVPERERQECLHKAGAGLRAIAIADRIPSPGGRR